MKRANDADARKHDYEDEHNKQPDRIHAPILSAESACARNRNAVRITVSGLRKRLGTPWLITVPGVGYRIETASSELNDRARTKNCI